MNVNDEYEKILGIPTHPCLFDPADDYDELRQSIINAPYVEYLLDKLPFDGIDFTINPKRKKRKRISTREKEMVLCGIISALRRRYDSST